MVSTLQIVMKYSSEVILIFYLDVVIPVERTKFITSYSKKYLHKEYFCIAALFLKC